MKRMISDILVVKIKNLIIDGYSTKSIKEIMMINHELRIDSGTLNNIKLGKTYFEIRPDLNDLIKNKLSISKKIDTQKVSDIKWALTNDDFTENEIKRVYCVSDNILMEIKLGYSPYCLISPEFNPILEIKYPRKKRNNIDRTIVIDIKKQYVHSDGDILLSDLANKHSIDKGSVSMILSLKKYYEVGKSFNSKIIAIKNKINKIKNKKNDIKEQIKTEKKIIKQFRINQNLEKEKVTNCLNKIKNLRDTLSNVS